MDMDIGTKLKGLRKDAGITQRVIADYLGIKVNSYSQYENNIRTPNIESLKKISDFYHISGIGFFLDSDSDEQLNNLRIFLDHYFDLLREIRGIYLEIKLLGEPTSMSDDDALEYNSLMSDLLYKYNEIQKIQTLIDEESDITEISDMIENYLK